MPKENKQKSNKCDCAKRMYGHSEFCTPQEENKEKSKCCGKKMAIKLDADISHYPFPQFEEICSKCGKPFIPTPPIASEVKKHSMICFANTGEEPRHVFSEVKEEKPCGCEIDMACEDCFKEGESVLRRISPHKEVSKECNLVSGTGLVENDTESENHTCIYTICPHKFPSSHPENWAEGLRKEFFEKFGYHVKSGKAKIIVYEKRQMLENKSIDKFIIIPQ